MTDVERALENYDAAANRASLAGADPEACRRRLEHALTEMLRSEQIHALLTQGPHDGERTAELLGKTMTAGHASMRDQAEVSFTMADRVVETVLAEGALGARLIGGGFGGSVLVLLAKNDAEQITNAAAGLSDDIRFLAVVPSLSAHTV